MKEQASKTGMTTLNFRIPLHIKKQLWKQAETLHKEAEAKFGSLINYTPSDLIRKILEDWSKKNLS